MSYLAKLLAGQKATRGSGVKVKKKKHSKKKKRLQQKYGIVDSGEDKEKNIGVENDMQGIAHEGTQAITHPNESSNIALRIGSDTGDEEASKKTNHSSKNNRIDSDSDSDAEPPRPPKNVGHRLDSDSDSDADPPRSAAGNALSVETPDKDPLGVRMKNGARAGLVKLEDYEREEERIRALRAIEKRKNPSTGKSMGTIYRTKTGQQMTADEALRAKAKEHQQSEVVRKRKLTEMSKGAVQKQLEQERALRAEKMAKTGFARYKDDAELETSLKQRHRADDPMAQYISMVETTNKAKSNVERANNSEAHESMSYPLYKGANKPLNRFKISPGYRWDGVERGNGFERKLLDSMSKPGIRPGVSRR